VKSRKDGLASWCKRCSNSRRKFHKKSDKKPEYKLVAQVVLKEGKPKTCPSCNAANVPSHLMRGHLLEDGSIKWDCVKCRNAELSEQRMVVCYCDWCCDEFTVVPHMKDKRFCDDLCLNAWRSARARRRFEKPHLEVPPEETRTLATGGGLTSVAIQST